MTISLWTGAATPSGWKVTARTGATSARLAVSTTDKFVTPTYVGPVAPANGVVTFTVTGQAADTDYWCAVEEDGVLDTYNAAHVRTFPTAGSAASFRVTVGSCAGASSSTNLHSVGVSNAPIFDTIRATAPLLFCHLGDMHYRNINADDPQAFRDAYDAVLAAPRQAELYRAAPLAYVWDDHDFANNDSDGTDPSRPAVSAVYRERVPSYDIPAGPDAPIYQTWTIGRVLFILSDTRHDRVPSTEPDGPDKTMLGATQKAWMRSTLETSGAELFVWMMPTPWMGYSSDTWAGYQAERAELVDMFTETGWVDRMVCINGDYHGLGMDTGGGNTWGGFPVYLWCSMDSPSSGGTPTTQYDMGPTSIGAERYGTLDITDTGDYLQVTGTGYIGESVWRRHTFYVTTTETATPPRSTTLTYDDTLARVRVRSAETVPSGYEALSDGFARTVVDGWGTADTGQAWTISGGDPSTYAVTGNTGRHTGTNGDARRFTRAGNYTDVEILGSVRCPVTPTGAGINAGLTARATDDDNNYLAWVSFNTSGTLQLSTYKRAAGTFTMLGQFTLPDTFDPARPMWIRLNVTGTTISARAWKDGSNEPGSWQLTATDTAHTSGAVGTYSIVSSGNTNGAVAVEFDGIRTTDPPHVYVDVERSTNQITWNGVRGGLGVDVAPGQAITVDDYEYTPDVPNYYRVTVRDIPLVGTILDQSIGVTTPTMTSVWLKSASRPFLNRPAAVVEMGAITRASRGTTFDVIGRSRPVSVTGVRGARTFDLTVLTDGQADADALDALLALGEPVLVHVPQACPLPIPTMYALVGDVSTEQPGRDSPLLLTTLPLAEVAPPGPDVIGATVTWASIANEYATWADLAAALPTWGDVLELIGDPADVVVE